MASDFSETAESDSDRTITPTYQSSNSSRSTATPASSYLSDRLTSSSYLPHLNHQTYTPGLFPFVKRTHPQRDSFYDSISATSRSLSNQTLQTHRLGPYGDSHRNSPVADSHATTTPLLPESATPHRSGTSLTSPTLKWSITPDTLLPINSSQPKKPQSPLKSVATKIPPLHTSRSSPSPSKATSNSQSHSQSQLHLQSLINCQSQARKTVSNSYSYPDQSRHDFYY